MKLEIYLPLEHREHAQHAINQCISSFGGCTVVKGDGMWKNDAGKLFAEPVKVVSICTETSDANIAALQGIARTYKQRAKQQAVLITVNNEPQFI